MLQLPIDITHLAYEHYKTDWVNNNTTPEMRLEAVRTYGRYCLECAANDIKPMSFEDHLFENGYGQGSIYVCFQEFCDAEYHDKPYMCSLLQHPDLIGFYYCDINEDNEP